MIQRGHITPYWQSQQIHELPFETHPAVFSGFDLVDSLDQERYSGITVDVHRGLPAVLASDLLEKEFAWIKEKSYAVSRMKPGTILPFHQDRYSRYKQITNQENAQEIWRCIVYLEDRAPGHFIDIKGYSLLDWRAGDWISWYSDTPHMACNLGSADRYSLQITGTPT